VQVGEVIFSYLSYKVPKLHVNSITLPSTMERSISSHLDRNPYGYSRPTERVICFGCCCCRSSVIFLVKVVSQDALEFQAVGNRSTMAALDAGCAGCARTTRPHWYAYALVNDVQAMQIFFTPLSVSLCFLFVLSLSSSFLFPLHFFLKSLFPSTQHYQS